MSKGRHSHFSEEFPRGTHPLCALHRRGLDQVIEVIAWVRAHPRLDTLRLVAEVARYPSLLQIIQGLRAGGFKPDFAARQIVDDCERAGIYVREDLRDVENITRSVYEFLDSLDAKVGY